MTTTDEKILAALEQMRADLGHIKRLLVYPAKQAINAEFPLVPRDNVHETIRTVELLRAADRTVQEAQE